jgi:branched-chain amino acid transport system ATP-binding protein
MAGDIVFRGEQIAGLPAHRRVRRGIVFVPEGKRIFRRRTAQENLLLGGYTHRLGRRGLQALGRARVYETFPAVAIS